MELKEMSLKELKKYDTYLFTIADIEVRDKEIERLKTELQETKEHLGEYLHEQEEENKRLNNIIKRLEEFIEKEIELYTIELTERNKGALGYTAPIKGVYKEIYNVLQELKGSDKDA